MKSDCAICTSIILLHDMKICVTDVVYNFHQRRHNHITAFITSNLSLTATQSVQVYRLISASVTQVLLLLLTPDF